MSKIDIRDSQCENCRKFSHCNNNELVCISKFKQLKAENEELKKQLQEESDLGHKAVQEEADSFFEALKYKQCLDKIEEIANAIVNGTHFTTDIEGHLKELTKQILQKIKEVK